MKIIFVVLLFIVPGLILKAIKEFIAISNNKTSKGTIYEQMFSIVLHSSIVSSIVLLIINIIYYILGFNIITAISILFNKLDNLGFLLFYSISMIIITLLWHKLFYEVIYIIVMKKINKILAKKYGIEKNIEIERTVLQDILYIDTSQYEDPSQRPPMIVAIYKDDKLVTAGELKEWNGGLEEPFEWKLINTCEILQILKEDNDRNYEDKWLQYIQFEYYNIEYDILVKFYKPDKACEHWPELELS